MISRRSDAKFNKNYELADQIRNELLNEGILLEDTKDGTLWKKI
jgi:cysteinyl-tRNA synthetase